MDCQRPEYHDLKSENKRQRGFLVSAESGGELRVGREVLTLGMQSTSDLRPVEGTGLPFPDPLHCARCQVF